MHKYTSQGFGASVLIIAAKPQYPCSQGKRWKLALDAQIFNPQVVLSACWVCFPISNNPVVTTENKISYIRPDYYEEYIHLHCVRTKKLK